ncbi:MAG: riboflavin biosynthesis protein RibF [Deferribacterales bacterium]
MEIIRNISSFQSERNMVVSLGNFDGVHEGHAQLIRRTVSLAKEKGLESALVTFEPHPLKFFGADIRLISTLDMKIREFEKLGADKLFLMKFDEHLAGINPEIFVSEFLVKKMRASFIVVGYDYRFGRGRAGSFDFLVHLSSRLGFTAIQVPKVEINGMTASSTNVRKCLAEGEIDCANTLLGRNFAIGGTVVKGDGIATGIGFPTANIEPQNELIPMNGIYAATVNVDGKRYNGALYIGERPTVGSGLKKRVEVNLFNFSGNLYGKYIEAEIVHFIRHDRKFGSVDELKAQIKTDCDNIKVFFERQK